MRSQLLPFLGTACLVLVTGVMGLFAFRTVASPLPDLPRIESGAKPQISTSQSLRHSRRVRTDRYYAAVTERPLFAPTRRPIEPDDPDALPEAEVVTEATPAVTSQEPPPLRLHGTMIATNGFSALLSHSGNEPEWLRAGTDIQGWKLSEIGDGWATLKNGNETFKLEMY